MLTKFSNPYIMCFCKKSRDERVFLRFAIVAKKKSVFL